MLTGMMTFTPGFDSPEPTVDKLYIVLKIETFNVKTSFEHTYATTMTQIMYFPEIFL